MNEALSTWVFSNSPSLGVVVAVLISTWVIAMKFGTWKGRFAKIDSENQRLNTKTERIDLQVREIKGDIKSMKVEIKGMKSTMNGMREDIKDLRVDMREMHGQMGKMQGQMDLVIKLLTDRNTPATESSLKKV